MTKRFLNTTIAAAVLVLTACVNTEQTITIKGSDTMVQLGQRWAEIYMKEHPEVTIQVTAGGSGNGIAALIGGTTQICQASRPMKDSEKESLKAKRNLEAIETPVALDALAIYVNKENSIKTLSLEQVSKIFLGEVTDWKEVGGAPGNIVLYGRENSSGTYVYFKEHVLADKDFPSKYQALPGTGAVVDAVAKDKGGIGYGGIGYAADIKTIPIARETGAMPVEPSMANVLNGTYPISRELYWYTAGQLEGSAKSFQDWVLGPEGQKIVSEKGFYPLRGE